MLLKAQWQHNKQRNAAMQKHAAPLQQNAAPVNSPNVSRLGRKMTYDATCAHIAQPLAKSLKASQRA
jgi:hypothetical protein